MGYKLPDGRYVDDQGKTWKNYNDAAAAATTRQRRAETEAELSRQRQLQLNAANKLEQGQLGKRFFGWVPGVGALQDRRMAQDAREKANADLAVNALQKQLAIHKGQMGEAPMPGAVQPRVEPAVNPPAPGLGAPEAYGDPAARAREAEQRRMMQQYASKEYWDTEQGKAMLSLGQQMTAPKDAKLSDYYGAQRAAGIGAMSEILEGLASVDDRYKEGGDLRKWAEANQGLALREYNKRFPGGFSNDEAIGALPRDYENNYATYQAHQAAQEGVDAFLAAQQARGQEAFRDLAKYPLADPGGSVQPSAVASGAYVPDTLVAGLNADGQRTVGEGAYGFDPAFDEPLPIAQSPAPPPVARQSNLAPVTAVAQQQQQLADELVNRYRYRSRTRGQLLSGT